MPSPIAFPQFRDELLALYRVTRAPTTHEKMRQVLAEVQGLEAVASTADLTPAAVAGYVERCRALGRHPNTTAGLLSYLRKACAYAVARRYLEASPFAAWSGWVTSTRPRRPRVHSLAAIARVMAYLAGDLATFRGARLHAWAWTLAATGLRRNESLFLERDDVDLAAGLIHVRPSARRRLKRPTAERDVPICEELGRVLAGWIRWVRPACPWVFPNTSQRNAWHGGASGYRPADRLAMGGRAAGVEGFHPHSLRHSFATHCATTWGVLPATLQAWMGHTSLQTTMRYYVHVDAAILCQAARAVRFGA